MSNSVEVQGTGQVVITEISEQAIELTTAAQPLTVEVQTAGPQGPPAPPYPLGDLTDVNATGKVANSVLYYDAISGKWKGDDINTVISLTDGGNF